MAHRNRPGTERRPVVLFAPHDPRSVERARDASLSELEKLLAGLGFQPVDRMVQRRRPDARTLLGAGQLEELRAIVEEARRRAGGELHLAVDAHLTPGQLHFLERALELPVLDRVAVVLRVFEQRARTPTAWLEIELARLKWELPRVREIEAARDRTGGGGGRGERGDTHAELARERIRARIAEVREKLDRLAESDQERRGRRAGRRVALVGYTNAGKSSLMRALTGADVYVEDALFATLGATVRALAPPASPPIFLTDTVGFLRNLPHELVASFRSTLAEARDADLLLHVVDGSDPEWPAQMRVTRESLRAIGAGELPELLVFNKADRIDEKTRSALRAAHPEALIVSSHEPSGVRRLREAIVAALDAELIGALLTLPHAEGRRLGEVRERARVVAETWTETGVTLSVRATEADLAAWEPLLAHRPAPETVEQLLELARLHGLELVAERDDFDRSGLDFLVAHALDAEGRAWVLRTPRRADVWETSRREARTLALLRSRLPIAVPDWQVHTRDLIAYPRLPGALAVTVDPIAGQAWNVIDPAAPGDAFLDSCARTLASLQAIEPEQARRAGVIARTIDEERERIAAAVEATAEAIAVPPALRARWMRWLDDDRLWPVHRALVHGDLHPGHLLLEPDGTLCGILDWTEAHVGDPATDFAMVHGCFGPAVLAELVRRFERAGGRTWPGLLVHAAERWAAYPAIVAEWALRTGTEAALSFARTEITAASEAQANA